MEWASAISLEQKYVIFFFIYLEQWKPDLKKGITDYVGSQAFWRKQNLKE